MPQNIGFSTDAGSDSLERLSKMKEERKENKQTGTGWNKTRSHWKNKGEGIIKGKGGTAYLKMKIDEKNKLMTLWLTEQENADRVLKEQILARAGEKNTHQYQTVVFISGERDLFSSAEGLILHNLPRAN